MGHTTHHKDNARALRMIGAVQFYRHNCDSARLRPAGLFY